MNANTRFLTHSSPFIIASFVIAVMLAGVNFVQASPDPPVSITNGIALFQGNQSNGIAGGVGKDFLVGPGDHAQCEFVDRVNPARQWRVWHQFPENGRRRCDD